MSNDESLSTSAEIQYLEPIGWQKTRSFSPVVISRGGATVWLAGQTTLADLDGKDIAGKFEEQARTIFALIDRSLQRAGGTLANLVTMTVFINDPRNGDRFVELRREFFAEGKCPASALVTVSNFARPGCVIEIQGVAVV